MVAQLRRKKRSRNIFLLFKQSMRLEPTEMQSASKNGALVHLQEDASVLRRIFCPDHFELVEISKNCCRFSSYDD